MGGERFKIGTNVGTPPFEVQLNRSKQLTPALCQSLLLGSLAAASTLLIAQQQRPPAVPLIAHDPYFSVWSMSDHLTDTDTAHWTGKPQPIHGLVRIDGKAYRFMGAEPRDVPAMQQTGLDVTPTHTIYRFQADGVQLTVTFFTPALPRDLNVLSRPVTYLTLTAQSAAPHTVSALIDVDPVIAVNTADESVTWGRSRAGRLTVLNVGSRDQRVLNRAGDDLRIDWGYFHLAVPDAANAQTSESRGAMRSFVQTGNLPVSDDMQMPREPRTGAAHLAAVLPFGSITAPVSRHILLAYTENYAIEYLGRKLRPYWQRNGESVANMLADAERDYASLDRRGVSFDRDLTADLEKAGGPAYTQLAVLAYRQTLAAHGFAADVDGTPMLFPKENFSNGCISTVDVLYPSGPFFLFFNPVLLQAQLKPVMEYAALPRWKWPFAPHDLGTYPLADGQVYGGGERTEENQMPVEESGNLLILTAAMERELGNWDFARQYWPQYQEWAAYLREKGLDPANQLSTDDFAGHLAHNANLSIKAIEGLAAFAEIARGLGKLDIANDYDRTAHDMAARWQTMARDGDHYKLAFDKPGTWSQKYNLVWDQLLGLHLFPASVRQTEIAFYLQHLNRYGLPLDNRATYTKLDWEIWTATLAGKPADWNTLLAPIGRWINEGPTRVPLTDWYDTITGKQEAFQARSVVGGVYIKMLADQDVAQRWRNRP
ncbi:MAG: glutaminase domain-containing protein [Acidobacteriota bacterium]